MKNRIFGAILLIGMELLGFTQGYTNGQRQNISDLNNVGTDVDIGKLLENAKNDSYDINRIITDDKILAYHGGVIGEVEIQAPRLQNLKIAAITPQVLTTKQIQPYDWIDSNVTGSIFLEVAPFDVYVKTYWIEKNT